MLGSSAVEMHVISCVEKEVPAPAKIGENIFYHQAVLPHWSYLRSLHGGPVLAVRKILSKISPDVVHAQGSERWAGWSGAFTGYPKVLTIHGFLWRINRKTPLEPRLYWKLQELLEASCLRLYDQVIAISEETAGLLAGRSRMVSSIPNAVESAFFEVARRPAPVPKLLNVGLLSELKNQSGTLRAMKSLGRDRPFELHLIGGDAPGWKGLETLKRDVAAESGWCSLRGKLDRAEVRHELAGAFALVHFSREENCPMVVLEAMAAGVPVIASRVGAVPDWIEHGVNGLMVDSGDEAALAREVGMLLQDPVRATKLGGAGRDTAIKLFHPRRVAEQHLDIYRDLAMWAARSR